MPPAQPKIYHILHVDRLASVIADNHLFSDSIMATRSNGTTIGMGTIKARRLRLPVTCHPGTCVGEYVPFYFCPRSIMLYVIHCANHPELVYRGGQDPIVHLEADLHRTVEWTEANRRRWAFSLSNAGAVYTQFRSRTDQLGEINWEAVAATNFQPADIKEGKQAECLIERSIPWQLIDRIGVRTPARATQVASLLQGLAHRPAVEIRRDWYY